VFLVQKEVAERIVRDKKESLLSLSIKAYGTPLYIKTVKKGNFTPSPNVDSAIIAVRDISKKHFAHIDDKRFFEVSHAGFYLGNANNS
jgi:16S rRNA A1518/A1519 N6-dimethyltransferase RsmA/KsgA/DIM1 with predicted DNA glycosylase/AP lyase activity